MYVTLRGVEEIRSLGFKQRSVSWDSFGAVGQISRTSFICPPMPATSHTLALAVIGPGEFGHLTGDTLLTQILHADK